MDSEKRRKKVENIISKIEKLGDLKKLYKDSSFDEKHVDEINKIKKLITEIILIIFLPKR